MTNYFHIVYTTMFAHCWPTHTTLNYTQHNIILSWLQHTHTHTVVIDSVARCNITTHQVGYFNFNYVDNCTCTHTLQFVLFTLFTNTWQGCQSGYFILNCVCYKLVKLLKVCCHPIMLDYHSELIQVVGCHQGLIILSWILDLAMLLSDTNF